MKNIWFNVLSRYGEIAYVSCILIHHALCWYVWFLLSTHALHNAEISNVSCILMQYAMLKCLISHVFSCITQWWNIWCFMYSHAYLVTSYVSCIPMHYAMLNNLMSQIFSSCFDIWFLMYYVMLKYLTSHALRNAEMSDF